MEFVEGIPLTDLASRVQGLSEAKKAAAKERILSRVSEAYGTMILKEGLFQVSPFSRQEKMSSDFDLAFRSLLHNLA